MWLVDAARAIMQIYPRALICKSHLQPLRGPWREVCELPRAQLKFLISQATLRHSQSKQKIAIVWWAVASRDSPIILVFNSQDYAAMSSSPRSDFRICSAASASGGPFAHCFRLPAHPEPWAEQQHPKKLAVANARARASNLMPQCGAVSHARNVNKERNVPTSCL